MLPLLPYIPYCARTHAGVSARFSPFQVQGRPSSIGSGDDAPVGRFDAIEAVGHKQHYITAVATFVIAVLSLRQFDEVVNEGK